jgi:Bifunctional DNA primase/polymerase, N-terminal
MTLLDYALQYLQRGWKPVPIPAGQKRPRIKEWQKLRLTETDAVKCFNGVGNIGVILGEASGGLIDIDLDCSEALEFAPTLLQPTESIFGRISKPRSHWLYRASPAQSRHFKDPIRGDTLLELRGDGGRQTVFPALRAMTVCSRSERRAIR